MKETLAFSAPHDKYQEIVGVLIVMKPGEKRIDLSVLHRYLDGKLHRSKWPQVIVFSDNGLPKNATGKILRIKFAQRIGLVGIDEESSPYSRLYEIQCPSIGTPLTQPIIMNSIVRSTNEAYRFLQSNEVVVVKDSAVIITDLSSLQEVMVAFVVIDRDQINVSKQDQRSADYDVLDDLKRLCNERLDKYLSPEFIYCIDEVPYLTTTTATTVAADNNTNTTTSTSCRDMILNLNKLQNLAMKMYSDKHIITPRNATEKQLELVWRSQLKFNTTLSVTSSFFDLGGNSLSAGQLVNKIRKQMHANISVADLFTSPTIESLSHKISTSKTLGSPHVTGKISNKERNAVMGESTTTHFSTTYGSINTTSTATANATTTTTTWEHLENTPNDLHNDPYYSWDFSPTLSNFSFTCLLVQALPVTIIFPVRKIIIWFLIAGPWVYLMGLGYDRFHALILAIIISRVTLGFLAPVVGILCKWIIIGII